MCDKICIQNESEVRFMAFCRFCGNKVNLEASFCDNCGAKIEKSETPNQTYTAEVISETKEVSKKNSILSMIFSIIGIFFSIFAIYPFAGIVFMFVGVIFTALSKKRRKAYIAEAGCDNGFSRAGKIVSTVAIPLIIVFTIIGLVLTGVIISEI